MKVLLCCYACDPRYGSEPGMGWNFTYHISKYHDVHVLVEKDEFEENLTRYSARISYSAHNLTDKLAGTPSYIFLTMEYPWAKVEYGPEALRRRTNNFIVHRHTRFRSSFFHHPNLRSSALIFLKNLQQCEHNKICAPGMNTCSTSFLE